MDPNNFNAFFQQWMQNYQQSSNSNSQFPPNHNFQPPQNPNFQPPQNPNFQFPQFPPYPNFQSSSTENFQFPSTENSQVPSTQNYESQVPEFSTQVGLENIDLETPPPGSNSKKKKETKPRDTWCHADDMNLVESWISTSKDSIKGDSQKSDGYWQAIANEFNKNRGSRNEKNYNQCKHRFTKISKEVQKFVGCYRQAKSLQQSGEVDTDVMNRARQIFEETEPFKSFTMEAAWERLKKEPKWCATNESASKRTKVSASGAYSSSSNPETPTSEYNPASPNFDRLIG